jgi:hypothetical protein
LEEVKKIIYFFYYFLNFFFFFFCLAQGLGDGFIKVYATKVTGKILGASCWVNEFDLENFSNFFFYKSMQ